MKLPRKGSLLQLEERKLILKYLKEGYSCAAISKLIGRSKNVVVTEVRRNGGKENYNPQEAQKMADERQKARVAGSIEKLKNSNFNPYVSISTKIRNLEEQMEILIDYIKDLKQTLQQGQ